MSMKSAKVGQWVTVDGHENEGPVQIERLYVDIDGGVRLAEHRAPGPRGCPGFVSWNVAELSPAKSP